MWFSEGLAVAVSGAGGEGVTAEEAFRAIAAGELPAAEDPEQLAAELSTMLTGADIAYLLHEDPSILDRVRVGIRARVEHWSGNGATVQKRKNKNSKPKTQRPKLKNQK